MDGQQKEIKGKKEVKGKRWRKKGLRERENTKWPNKN